MRADDVYTPDDKLDSEAADLREVFWSIDDPQHKHAVWANTAAKDAWRGVALRARELSDDQDKLALLDELVGMFSHVWPGEPLIEYRYNEGWVPELKHKALFDALVTEHEARRNTK